MGYFLFAFTDFVEDVQSKRDAGNAVLGLFGLIFCINAVVLLKDLLKNTVLYC